MNRCGPFCVAHTYGFPAEERKRGHCEFPIPNELLQAAAKCILYVLTVSRRGNDCARYQSAAPCSFDGIELFAHTFQEYFEGDARQHLWFIGVPTEARLVYDNHDLIYSYGNDDGVISIVKSKGLSEGNPQIPWPHEHCYNEEFDASEGEIMEYCEWAKFPLKEYDNP